MQSSWASKSPLRWESDQSPFQSRVKPASEAKHAEEEVRMDLSAPRITEEGAPSSLSVDNLIAEEEILSSLSVENFSDLSVLSERLKEIELLEKIELAEHRLRSLHLSQLSSRPSDEIKNMMSEMAQSTRMMAQFQGKAAEKDSNENSKLVGLNTGGIMQFLSSFNRKSCQPVYCQVSVKTRKALALTLGVPIGTTLESFYGEELGPDVPFIRDLKISEASLLLD